MPLSQHDIESLLINLSGGPNSVHLGVARPADPAPPHWLHAVWALLAHGAGAGAGAGTGLGAGPGAAADDPDGLAALLAAYPERLDQGREYLHRLPHPTAPDGADPDQAADATPHAPAHPDQTLACWPSQRLRQLQALMETVWTGEQAWPQAIPGQDAAQEALQIRLWRAQLLQAQAAAPPAAHVAGHRAAHLAVPRALFEAPGAQTPWVTLPVLLVNTGPGGAVQGCVARLRLWRWWCPAHPQQGPAARLHLLPTLAQACVPVTQGFAQSLHTVAHFLRQQVPAAQAEGQALVWDLAPLQGGMHLLSGPSASAAVGLAGLWLLREHLAPAWRHPLTRLTRADLRSVYLSAELRPGGPLAPQGPLAPVGGIGAKDGALVLARLARGQLGRDQPLYVAADQPEAKPEAAPDPDDAWSDPVQPLLLSPHETLLSVVQALKPRPMTPAQTTLYQALGEALAALPEPPGPADSGCPRHLPPRLDTTEPVLGAALTALDSVAPAAAHASSHPLHYALRGWAERGRAFSRQRGGQAGQVHQRFVNLQLSAPLPGADGQSRAEGFDSLEQMLDAFEHGQHRAHCPSAFLIEGAPGAGKSFLMARHEQALYEQYIWHDLQHDAPLAQAPVLPLYLPLNLLPPQADPAAFYRQWLLARYPDERLGLAQRLDPARRAEGPAPFRLRLMIDGLNEVQAERSPELRAQGVVIQLWQAFAPDLPLLLGIRPGREWKLYDPVQRFSVRTAVLKAWTRAQIKRYLEQRWAGGDTVPDPAEEVGDRAGGAARVLQFLRGLPKGSDHEKLLGTPLYLNLQCELWEAGAQRLLANRAHLLAAMLWLRLGQELEKATVTHKTPKGDERRLQGPLAREGMVSEREVEDAARFLQRPGQPPEFPRQGWLLQGLFAQAKAQWLAAPGADRETRGQVVLPQSAVERSLRAAGLPEEALANWLQAVQDLGLARLERLDEHSEAQFRYEHQVFGEWLASAELFYTGAHTGPGGGRRPGEQPLPAHWSAEALARLGAELAPPPLAHSAEEELQVQRQRAAQAWGDPKLDDLLAEWRDQGLSLPLSEVQATLDEARGIPYWDSNMLDVYQNRLGFISIDARAGRCAWRFDALARANLRNGRLKPVLPPGRPPEEAWHEDRAAWALVCQLTEIWPVFKDAAKQAMADRLGGPEKSDPLWTMGRLGPPPPGGLDDIAPLALDALGDTALLAWLGWLVQTGPWALASAALVHARERLRALAAKGAAQAATVAALWAASSRRLLAVVNDAGALQGGADPRQRLQAGERLGAQGEPGSPEGDQLRFERSGPGLRLRPAHWLAVGGPGQRFRLGDPACSGGAAPFLWLGDGPGPDGQPLPALPAFQIAQLPVTVAEYQRFIDDGGYGPAPAGGPAAPGAADTAAGAVPRWWQAAGPAALAWLQQQERRQPALWGQKDFSNPLQPVVGVSWYEALAYCHWAAEGVYADRLAALNAARPGGPRWVLRLPTEWEWEAAVRGPHTHAPDAPPLAWPGHGPQGDRADEPHPMLFNHAATGWARPSPVGCWGASRSATGLLDVAGNALTWCANRRDENWASAVNGEPVSATEALHRELRALRGGSFSFSAALCRVGNRDGSAPGVGNVSSGFRLVLAVVL